MESGKTQLDVALWLLSDQSNNFVKKKADKKVVDLIENIRSDHRNTFSFCEALLAATEIYFENDGITNWFYNSFTEWIDDACELWLGDQSYYNTEVAYRSFQAAISKVSFLLGKRDENFNRLPSTDSQFDEEVAVKQIKFYRST